MTKKFLAAFFIGAAIFMTGCGDDAENFNEDNQKVAQAMAKTLPTFNATDLDGKPVTNAIFASKAITMVNIWGTFCPPCKAEMPELGEMARNNFDDVQLIGIVCDAEAGSEQVQDAKKILRDANADFVNIVPDAQLQKFLNDVDAVPTTIFVNSKGEIIGKVIVGADVAGYKDELHRLTQGGK